jgi:hypothetical protein
MRRRIGKKPATVFGVECNKTGERHGWNNAFGFLLMIWHLMVGRRLYQLGWLEGEMLPGQL